MREAQAELAAARSLYETRHWAWCCFTCQQVAHKALRALCERFRTPQTGHNLNLLVQAVVEHVAVPDSVRRGCARLNRYDVPTRYPNAFDRGVPAEPFFEEDARLALEDAEEVVHFASGFDVLVGLREDDGKRWWDRLGEWEAPEGPVEVFPYSRTEWERMFESRYLLLLDALEHGVVLWDHGSFARMRATFRRWREASLVVPWRDGWRIA